MNGVRCAGLTRLHHGVEVALNVDYRSRHTPGAQCARTLCIHTYAYEYTYAYVYIYISGSCLSCASIKQCLSVGPKKVRVCVWCVSVCMHVCVSVCMHACVRPCRRSSGVIVYACVCVHVYAMCVCVHAYAMCVCGRVYAMCVCVHVYAMCVCVRVAGI